MSVLYDEQAEKAELKVTGKNCDERYYQRPTEKELADCRFCRLFIIASFILLLLGLLIAAIVLIALTDKCSNKVKPVAKDTSIAYQISVGAFADSDLNGTGDLIGVKNRLNWIYRNVGASKLVLSDVVNQENFDLNTDIGTKDDLKALLKACHDKQIKVLVQMNPTAVSSTSKWFQESKNGTSKTSWFIWRRHNETNNWVTVDNHTAWHQVSNVSNSSYYSYYGKHLPALNYNDPNVREKVKKILGSWLDLGVDGFFFTSVARLAVDPKFQSNKPGLFHDKDTSQSHDVLASFYEVIRNTGGLLYVSPESNIEENMKYLGSREKPQADVVVYDQLATMNSIDVKALVELIDVMSNSTPYHGSLGWIAGGNGFKRLATRFPDQDQARLLSMFLFVLPNVVLPFYGDEFLLKDKDGKSDVTMEWKNTSESVWEPKFNLLPEYSELTSNRTSLTSFEHIPKVFHSQKEFISLIYGGDILVAVNFGKQTVKLPTNGTKMTKGRYLFHTNPTLSGKEIGVNKSFNVSSSHLFIMKLYS